nr:DUF5685 family protein [Actinomycetospora chiangmaiensis]
MFGFLRPCRHHLGPELHGLWSSHLCGLCLALRDGAGQPARVTTHVDALVVSVLGEAQGVVGTRRAGPCPLRGMRPATVVTGEGARLAASTALLLAADRVADHVEDRDGAFASRPAAVVGKHLATRWSRAGTSVATDLGFDPAALLAVPARQREVEARVGSSLRAVTAPTEAAVGAALAHTAVLAGRPGNAAPLDEAGRLLGRLAHLLDAVADLDDDAARGRWNPLAATGVSRSGASGECRATVAEIGAALRRVSFVPGPARRLAHVLLVHETGRAVERAAGPREPLAPWDPAAPGGEPPGEEPPDGGPPDPPSGPGRRGLLAGCAAAAGLCCTGQLCCADEFVGPWSGQPRQNPCGRCSDCVDCSECSCDCCDDCSSCGDCCSCDCGS